MKKYKAPNGAFTTALYTPNKNALPIESPLFNFLYSLNERIVIAIANTKNRFVK
jgi:hypothetical protein